ncbi:MAG: hypothetical protein GWN84_09725 [Gammaproteobacteria bacterium]|nr:hypothetical protein [Gammaproteobacteria bacterium]NIR83143.1 hypothetical protein [Gammaproteobacteria bacterium]NIR90951.1 hypothetical protein [Gammaproteobacteria bacterium]NIU04308.1 hypothetical protein [Gammaproteobacteria bacterium]NIV52531.1 hypothetical protein [Gammaproteobacteria bacterium]
MDDVKKVESELRDEITSLRRRLDSLDQDVKSKAVQTAIAEEGQRVEENLRKSIEGSLRFIRTGLLLLGAAISIIIGGLGYFGLEALVPSAVNKLVEERASTMLSDLEDEVETRLHDAKSLYGEALERHREPPESHLIVLLTDFGPKSPDMGILTGAIYNYSYRARVETLTTGIEAFNTFEAAWTLRRAMELYPEDTIFVTIAGHPGQAALYAPVIVRTKSPAFTLVGYTNGVFDFAVERFGHERSYRLSWPAFYKTFTGSSEQALSERPEAVAKILGPVASVLSTGETPWAPRDAAWEGLVNADESYHFSEDVSRYHTRWDRASNAISATVMEIDRFGNATTNITRADLERIVDLDDLDTNAIIRVYARISPGSADEEPVELTLGQDYSAGGIVGEGEPVAVLSRGLLQLALFKGSFSATHGVDQRTPLVLCADAAACEGRL